MSKLEFKAGDLAVYPAHGVTRIEKVEEKEVGGESFTFYVLHVLENDMKVMVPIQNAETVGLRNIISKKEVKEVYDILQKKDVKFTSQTWNRRYREYMEKIKTGSIFELAAVLRDLYILQKDKPLSFGERKMLDTARTLLVKEMAIAQGKKETAMLKEIEDMFGVQEQVDAVAAKLSDVIS
jgi:CarD family transcriptional regulator